MATPGKSFFDPKLWSKTTEVKTVDKSVFAVSPGADGKWNVMEEGFGKAIAFFDDKDDAIDYATGLAKAKPSSRINVRNGMGSTEATLEFEDGEPV